MRSVMSHNFSQVPQANVPRSVFDRSHGLKTAFDAAYLVPIFVDEVLPGDTFNLQASLFGRLATPLVPIMDNLFLDTFWFFVPYRLVWENWQKFNGEQDNPADSTSFVIPTMTSPAVTGYSEGSLYDFMGIPTKIPGLEHSSLPMRAYNLIWNQWFRSESLQNSVVVDTDNGPDNPADYVPLGRGKRFDYFTSCLPWPQKGSAVELPLGLTAPVVTTGNAVQIATASSGGDRTFTILNGTNAAYMAGAAIAAPEAIAFGTDSGLEADLSSATAATINQLREAFQIQKLLERDARGGTRYVEVVKAHFGVTVPDFRVQRPEYLGGGSQPLTMTPVPQTSESAGTPQGTLAAYGIVGSSGHGFVKSFTEHGVVIGLANLRADLNYQQGLNRMWSRQTRYDFYWPALAHLGEQAVLNKEIYAVGSGGATDDDVFGYQERWAEYRYKPSQVCGVFRSNATASLDIWHLAQDFAALPVLNSTFIVDNPPVDRVIATPSEPHLILDCYFQLKCARPMPIYSVPGLIDHF